jgi:4-amino-4-deoxychorismate lyase
MSLFFETLFIYDCKIRNLSYHNARLNRTIKENFDTTASIDLSKFVDTSQEGKRCKVIYGSTIQNIEYYPGIKRNFKCFRIIESDINYRYKYFDRSQIDELSARRGECDDIIIVHDGKVLDTTIANIAYFDGKHWITPAMPLLEGTTRARLLDEGKIVEGDVSVEDILSAKKMAIMNAVIGFQILSDKLEIRS